MGVAIGLFAMICLLDPKEIVIGGSVAVKNPFYVERIKAVLERYAHKEQMHILPHIRVTDLGGDNGIIGGWLPGDTRPGYSDLLNRGNFREGARH